MKKLVLVLSLMVTGLAGCYIEPYRDHDDGRGGARGGRDGYR